MKGLEGISFEQGDCKVVFDANQKTFNKEMEKIVKEIKTAWNKPQPESTLYFVYYAGHGVMRNNQTYAVLGVEKNKQKALYPLEANLRAISKIDGGYIICVLACCRERFEIRGTGDA